MRPTIWRTLALVIVLLVAFNAPAYSQNQARNARSEFAPASVIPVLAAAPQPQMAQNLDQTQFLYLPLLRKSPEVQILLGSSANEQFEVTAPATVFAVGITRLYIDARFYGAQGLEYRVDTFTPSGEAFEGSNSTAFDPIETDRYYICKTTAFRCGSGEVALDPGTYTVRAYLNDVLVQEVTASIQ